MSTRRQRVSNGHLSIRDVGELSKVSAFCEANLHLCACRETCVEMDGPLGEKDRVTTYLDQLVYCNRRDEFKSVLHWGQRKLLLTEVELLNEYGSKLDVVIYVGSAPCIHLKCLRKLWPKVRWLLVDPAPFAVKEEEGFVKIMNEYCTDAKMGEMMDWIVANWGRGLRVSLVSDIRRDIKRPEDEGEDKDGDAAKEMEGENEETVKEDMQWQWDWWEVAKKRSGTGDVKLIVSMFKFRLPYKPEIVEYLAGEARMQVWPGSTSTETRLWVVGTGGKTKEWDSDEYNNKMMWFNVVKRLSWWQHDIVGVPGICHCYDCACEIYLWKRYLMKHKGMTNPADIRQKVAGLIEYVSDVLGLDLETKTLREWRRAFKKTGHNIKGLVVLENAVRRVSPKNKDDNKDRHNRRRRKSGMRGINRLERRRKDAIFGEEERKRRQQTGGDVWSSDSDESE